MEYSTNKDFFLENQIVYIVHKKGTKFCSLIKNHLFMCPLSHHFSRQMWLHIMYEIRKYICRFRYRGVVTP